MNKKEEMKIVFDLDNTLIDEFGSSIRPGILDILERWKKEYKLSIWTNSSGERAKAILWELKLKNYFTEFVFREDYDPENKGIKKDIRKIGGDVLIDDDPVEIEYVKSFGKKGFLIKPYRKGLAVSPSELDELLRWIKK